MFFSIEMKPKNWNESGHHAFEFAVLFSSQCRVQLESQAVSERKIFRDSARASIKRTRVTSKLQKKLSLYLPNSAARGKVRPRKSQSSSDADPPMFSSIRGLLRCLQTDSAFQSKKEDMICSAFKKTT